MQKSLFPLLFLLIFISACEKSTNSPSEILQKKWVAHSIFEKALPKDVKISFSFLAENRIAGANIGNRYMGTYSYEKGLLAIKNVGSTRMAVPKKYMEQEKNFLKALTLTQFMIIKDEELIFLSAEKKEVLRFSLKKEK